MKYPFPMNDHFTSQIWPFVAQHNELSFYELEEPRQLIKTFDRSEIIDHEYAQLVNICGFCIGNVHAYLWLFPLFRKSVRIRHTSILRSMTA